jgi:hypothetical protein
MGRERGLGSPGSLDDRTLDPAHPLIVSIGEGRAILLRQKVIHLAERERQEKQRIRGFPAATAAGIVEQPTRPGAKSRPARRAGPSITAASRGGLNRAITTGPRIADPITGSRWISSKRSERTVITTVTGEPGHMPSPSTARNSSRCRPTEAAASCSAWSTVMSKRLAGDSA